MADNTKRGESFLQSSLEERKEKGLALLKKLDELYSEEAKIQSKIKVIVDMLEYLAVEEEEELLTVQNAQRFS